MDLLAQHPDTSKLARADDRFCLTATPADLRLLRGLRCSTELVTSGCTIWLASLHDEGFCCWSSAAALCLRTLAAAGLAVLSCRARCLPCSYAMRASWGQ